MKHLIEKVVISNGFLLSKMKEEEEENEEEEEEEEEVFITEARNEELTETQTKEIEASTERACPVSARTHKKGAAKSKPWNPDPATRNKQNTNSKCRNCGGPFPHSTSCFAKGKICLNCKKPNNVANVCRSKKAEVKQITEDSSETEEIFTLWSSKKVPTTSLLINNQNISFIIDTGASVSVITEATYNNMKKKPQLKPSSTAIYGYNAVQKLPALGCFTTTASHKKYATKAMFHVVQNHDFTCSNLLFASTSETLGIISFAHSIKVPHDIFHGFGKLEGINIKLQIDYDVQPKAQAHRRIPYHVRKDVEKELKRLEEQDIIEEVESSTPWMRPIVVVHKKLVGVRLCVDMREANKAIERERHPMPTIEDMINDLNGSTVFSRIDLQQAFHQLELNKESRFITTFSTHVRPRRFKRLMFGVNAAPEIFQHARVRFYVTYQASPILSTTSLSTAKPKGKMTTA
ncbi:retrovirus-related pol polyprotein from transposon 412 [Plakobranchus ocellatus]|uniref:Retrovirus-related pol polyprotein from transposon 412 n=1 Tax=Plakobranchus ocellatus TaxID=259542 RepID=A0AAV4C980_9GAST|nr:retrovirus-related pol polyprotein from transposon 412 [Plakobranchus ocellatus]